MITRTGRPAVPALHRGRRAVAVCLAVALTAVALVLVPTAPASADGPTTPPPDSRPVVPYGHQPGFCTAADPNPFGQSSGAIYGWAWSPNGNRWTQVPTCVFKWDFIGLSQPSVVVDAGGVATFSLSESAAAPFIPTAGGAIWQVGNPSRIVSGCGSTDVTCSFRVGTAGQDPANWTYEVIQLSAPSSFITQPVGEWGGCSPTTPCPYLRTNVWGAVAVRPGGLPPTASFSATPDTTRPGAFTLSSDSTDPRGEPLLHEWDFGDGTSRIGAFVIHEYDEPGDYTVSLTVTNQQRNLSNTTTRVVTVDPPRLSLSIDLLDGAAPPLDAERPVRVRVTASASSDGVGDLTGLRFEGGDPLTVSPADLFSRVGEVEPEPSAEGFDLAPGEQSSFVVTLEPAEVGRYLMTSALSGVNPSGAAIRAEAESRGEVGQALEVELTLDPPTIEQDETDEGPEPVDVEVSVTLRNTTESEMTDVRLTSLRVDRTAPGQLLAVEQTGGVRPEGEGVAVGTLAAGEERVLTATFRATDDAEVEFSAMATALRPGGAGEIGVGRARWSVTPKYLIDVSTQVDRPANSALLPAGETIRVSGRLKNLSTTATVEVAPLYPTLAGNAGVTSFVWDPNGRDPRDLEPAQPITLGPAESVEFSVRVLTAWSDPRRIEGDNRHGGTWAELSFTPWGRATLEDGTVEIIEPDRVKADAADLEHRISIDDSIEIPNFDPLAFGGAVMVGGVEGVWNGTVATLWGVVELAKLPYTTIRATSEFQAQVWNSFTEEEKEAFAADAALMTAAVLMRNAELGKEGAEKLYQQAKDVTLASMIEMANEWQVGDYTSTSRLYARYGADAITQVAVPTALAKMAKSPVAAAALTRAQEAVQARMAPLLAQVRSLRTIEELGPVLNALESGVELLPEQLAVLYGIAPEELTELQALATKYNFLLTVRSRHASSIEWIQRFGAKLKPEALKIKSVSELDTKLGYRESDIGSLVFRKPEPLRRFDAGDGELGALVNEFVKSKGFVEGTGDWENAINRVVARAGEWRKWEKSYKQWDEVGWFETSFNYSGNAIDATVRKGTGRYEGFRLREIGEESFVVEMLDNKQRRFVPVTGDIDPIAFTHLDGSPLTAVEHADLLDDMRKNPLLQAQHGESTTFVKGGVDFVVSQFKPNEPGLQIAPGGFLPRVVRLNAGLSRWENAFDYHIHWDGGFVYSGTHVERAAVPRPSPVLAPATLPPAPKPRPLPAATSAEPNVGRCRVTHSAAPGTAALFIGVTGAIKQFVDGVTNVSPLADRCFTEGPPIEVSARPVTEVAVDTPAGTNRIEVKGDEYLAGVDPATGFAAGQQVLVGAGTPGAATYTITGFGSIILDRPLESPVAEGDLILVVVSAPGAGVPPTTVPPTTVPPTTVPPTTVPPTTVPPTTVPPTTVPPTTLTVPSTTVAPAPDVPDGAVDPLASVLGTTQSAAGGSAVPAAGLALTGEDSTSGLALAVSLIVLGLLFVGISRRRRDLEVAGEPLPTE